MADIPVTIICDGSKFNDAMRLMERGIAAAFGLPPELLEGGSDSTSSELIHRIRQEQAFRYRPIVRNAALRMMFAAFIKVPNWRRVKRERRKAAKRARALIRDDGYARAAIGSIIDQVTT